MASSSNIIITGVPRSGTTLVTAMIDSVPNAVGLNEPDWQTKWIKKDSPLTGMDYAKWLAGDFAETRAKLLHSIPIPERRGEHGEAVTNYYLRRENGIEIAYEIKPFVRPGLSDEFTLAMKHCGLYLGVLPELAQLGCFKIIAILRHPVEVIASWRSLNNQIPPSSGSLPGALYWPEMQELTHSPLPLLEKQVRMYDLICRRFKNLEKKITVLRYEDILRDAGFLWQPLGIKKKDHGVAINQHDAFYYKTASRDEIRNAIKQYGQHLFHYYEMEA